MQQERADWAGASEHGDPLSATWRSVESVVSPPGAPVLDPLDLEQAPGSEPGPARPPRPPVLEAPWHSGNKPPMYPPVPQGLPAAGADLEAAVLPDIVVDGAAYGPLTVRAVSVRGDSHRYLGEPRQDALCVTRIGGPETGEMLLLAVADGVGSARRSHIGSNEVCRLAAAYLDRVAGSLLAVLEAGDGTGFAELADGVVGQIAALLTDRAVRAGQDPGAYATTLRALLVPLDPAVRTRGFLAVGDGGTSLLREGAWQLDITGEEDEGSGMIDTRTAALPFARTAVTRLIGPARPGDVFVLCTDGLSTPLAGEPEMRAFLGAAWGSGVVPGPADFLWQAQYRVKSYDDDRTAVVLWEGTA
ncbi:protein phosphatase 2C domain-containing protein [Streptomyces sp. NPDC055287]